MRGACEGVCEKSAKKAKAARSDRVREACKGVCKKTEKAKAATSNCVREACEVVYEEAVKNADAARSRRVLEDCKSEKLPKVAMCKKTAKRRKLP